MTDATAPMPRYRALVRDGRLRDDPAQKLAVEKLQLLHERLRGYEPARPRRVARGWFGWGREPRHERAALNGLYLYGGVGRGKSMLMDLFFETAPVSPKRRVHFHAFMQEVHAGINAARAEGLRDPIAHVAQKIAAQATLLCFDELQITDIADAMIVGRLFEALFARGVVVVATSNRHPDELYKDGLNRQLFLPFIALIKERLDLHHLESPIDHRRGRLRGQTLYHAPLGPVARAAMDAQWREMAGEGPAPPLTLTVAGREVTLPQHRDRIARASFADLCARPLGPADYLAVARALDMLFVDDVPRLGPADANAARRFVTLIDALYEGRVRLAMSAEAPPEELYVEGAGAFEFERTVSRLHEMQSDDWPPET
ncbi:cell division protein ZapE [Oceanicella actignis]|uniref:Cell division protein ZapE n=1 Tax=Oceanicella actignis TaxID=1189325 RepID=A0A1M7TA89_9RHOB|nr:cell division protein ZapE [Oceanicella actignis]SET52177.1 cell division protein ZapE [Oceanicella actignis]SHN67628.1 cell division protein ZapE [Oceanicella actignis]